MPAKVDNRPGVGGYSIQCQQCSVHSPATPRGATDHANLRYWLETLSATSELQHETMVLQPILSQLSHLCEG